MGRRVNVATLAVAAAAAATAFAAPRDAWAGAGARLKSEWQRSERAVADMLHKYVYHYAYPEDALLAVPSFADVTGRVRVADFGEVVGALDEREALVLKGSPILKEWSALREWARPDALGQLTGVEVAADGSRVHVGADESAAMRAHDPDADVMPFSQWRKENMTSAAFVRSSRRVRFSQHWSDADDGPTGLGARLGADVRPRHFFYVVDDDQMQPRASDFGSVVSLAKPGVVDGFRVERTHAMLAQVAGCRRVLVAPPSQWRRLRAFPWGHPSAGHSQLELPGVARFVSAKDKVEVLVADLSPGDVLYVPPSFAVRTEAFACGGASDQGGRGGPAGAGGGGMAGHSVGFATLSSGVVQRLALELIADLRTVPQRFLELDKDAHGETVAALGIYLARVAAKVGSMPVKELLQDVIVRERFVAQPLLGEAFFCTM